VSGGRVKASQLAREQKPGRPRKRNGSGGPITKTYGCKGEVGNRRDQKVYHVLCRRGSRWITLSYEPVSRGGWGGGGGGGGGGGWGGAGGGEGGVRTRSGGSLKLHNQKTLPTILDEGRSPCVKSPLRREGKVLRPTNCCKEFHKRKGGFSSAGGGKKKRGPTRSKGK